MHLIVQGWRVDGKWQRKQFSDEGKAQPYPDSVNINLRNAGRERELKLTTLGEVDIDQAERAIEELQGFYSLDELVSFHLKHHRALDFKISFFAF